MCPAQRGNLISGSEILLMSIHKLLFVAHPSLIQMCPHFRGLGFIVLKFEERENGLRQSIDMKQ